MWGFLIGRCFMACGTSVNKPGFLGLVLLSWRINDCCVFFVFLFFFLCTSRGNPGFPASTRESPRETFFNTSRGQIPLPWLRSNDALPLATRMETRLPWRPTRGSLTSPSYLVRNRTLGPPLENNPEIHLWGGEKVWESN